MHFVTMDGGKLHQTYEMKCGASKDGFPIKADAKYIQICTFVNQVMY